MNEPATFGAFEAVLQLIVRDGEGLSVGELSRRGAMFTSTKGLRGVDVVVLRVGQATEALQAHVRTIIKAPKPRPLDIVLVGGGADVAHLLQNAAPSFTRKRVGLVHVGDDLSVWSKSPVVVGKLLGKGDELRQKLSTLRVDAASWRELEAATEASRARHAEHRQQLQGFAKLALARRPLATWTLMGLIGVVFASQLYVGTTVPPQLLRMGALSPERVLGGEWWRLLSCTLVHGGLMHVLFNTYVLYALGVFLERIIGPGRLLILYVGSALAGSVGSALFLGAKFSVGASGAVWGLLGAHAVMAFRSEGLLPEAMIPGARKAAMINLGINVLNSFLPFVDMWAHFAGGAAGALLFMAITRGIPRLPQPGQAWTLSPRVPASAALNLVGVSALLLLPAAMATALVVGNPFALKAPPDLVTTPVESLGIELSLPRGAEPETAPDESEILFGDPLADPAFLGVFTTEVPTFDVGQAREQMAMLRESLATPENARLRAEPREFDDGNDVGLFVDYELANGLVLERAFLIRPNLMVRVEAYRWPGLPAAPPGIAETIVRTAQVLR